MRGGNFKSGYMSAFFSKLAGGIDVGEDDWVQGAFQTLVGGTASEIGGGKFANGVVSAAVVYLFNDMHDPRLKRSGIAQGTRENLNKEVPYSVASKRGSGWIQLDESAAVFHDNGRGKSELKFVHPNGYEVIYDGDTHEIVTNPLLKGTYNFVHYQDKDIDLSSKIWRSIFHTVFDVVPFMVEHPVFSYQVIKKNYF